MTVFERKQLLLNGMQRKASETRKTGELPETRKIQVIRVQTRRKDSSILHWSPKNNAGRLLGGEPNL
jgi:hypothetical protein